MRTAAITLNAVAAVCYACFLAYTFFARQHLDGLARDFVTEKTLEYSEPIVDLAEGSLEMPFVQPLLTAELEAAVRDEIARYRADGAAYIADLTRQELLPAEAEDGNPVLEQIVSAKEKIRVYYDETLAALIRDLRIFSASNLTAALIALGLACWSQKTIRQSVVWFSILMFVGVLYCSWMYVDDLTFFRILFRMQPGWRYPLILAVVVAGLFVDYGRWGMKSRAVDGGDECAE